MSKEVTFPIGGPAFPVATFAQFGGMSLRDYFAATALPACMAQMRTLDYMNIPPEEVPVITARSAYAMADAMLAERAK